jgi:hypothetical protein
LNLKRLTSGKWFSWTARIILTVLFVYIANRSLSAADVRTIAGFIRLQDVTVALLLGMTGMALGVWRWNIILRHDSFAAGPLVALKTVLVGNLFAFVTPGRLGEFFRGIGICEQRKGDAVLAVAFDKLFMLLATLICGVICFAVQGFLLGINLPPRAVLISFFSMTVCAIGILIVLLWHGPREGSPGIKKTIRRILSLCPRLLTKNGAFCLLLSLAAQFILIVQTVVLIRMFGDVSISKTVLAVGQSYAFMAFLPFFIANMGIREYSFGLFLANVGVEMPGAIGVSGVALGASSGILAINLILPALGGLAWIILDAWRGNHASGRQ